MVYGLMCHSVGSSQLLHFSIFYTPEGNDAQKKTRQQTIMRRILEEHLFQTLNSECDRSRGKDDDEWFLKLGEKGTNLERQAHKNAIPSDKTEGIIHVNSSPPLFKDPKLVVWKQFENVAYTLICEHPDNPLLANNFLTLFIAELHEQFRLKRSGGSSSASTGGSTIVDEIIGRPDDILLMLHYLLPNGTLHFINFDLYMYLKTQIVEALAKK